MPSAFQYTRSKLSRLTSSTGSDSSRAVETTEVVINVYDLLPPGRLSSILWTIGGSLLHSGVVINDKEYAYGGHNRRGITGVYWTKPRLEPPGGTWRCSVPQGTTCLSAKELETLIKEVSDAFPGTSYSLLTNNCNHFTSALCEKLSGKGAPAWLNRAAGIGVALPCVVPREWVQPPDAETADGELLDDEDGEESEAAEMLISEYRRLQHEERRRHNHLAEGAGDAPVDEMEGGSMAGGARIVRRVDTPPPRPVAVRDVSGRVLPVAERAPVPIPRKS